MPVDTTEEYEIETGTTLTYNDYTFGQNFDDAIRGLDDDDRDAFILTELRGLTVREAAAVLGSSKDTVHRRAEAARQQLQDSLELAA